MGQSYGMYSFDQDIEQGKRFIENERTDQIHKEQDGRIYDEQGKE